MCLSPLVTSSPKPYRNEKKKAAKFMKSSSVVPWNHLAQISISFEKNRTRFYCQTPGHFKRDCHRFKLDLEHGKINKEQGCSKDYERAFPLLLTDTLGETEITIGGETSKALEDTGATLSILSPTLIHCPLPWSKQSVQMVRVSNLPMQVLKSEPITFQLGTITEDFCVPFGEMCSNSFDRKRPLRGTQCPYCLLT